MSEKEGEEEGQILSEDTSEYDLSFKIIVVGDAGVGKSCLTLKATKDQFETSYNTTVGFEFYTMVIKIKDKVIRLQIWDTCGQEVYKSLILSFYRNASLAIIVYAINDNNTFTNIERWLNEIKTVSNPQTKIFLIGNKVDLKDDRKVDTETAKKFSKEHEFQFFLETSAKTGINVKEVFVEAAKELYKNHLEYKDRASRLGSMLDAQDNNNKFNNLLLEEEDDKNKGIKKKGSCC
jgi:small GTP-binding protein